VYRYMAKILRVIDGDTVEAEVDLGFRIYSRHQIRLNGINTPERGQPKWEEAKRYLENAVLNIDVQLDTFKGDKYGRWLANIFPVDSATSVNSMMLAAGLAEPYKR
jgi:micrococcal nuclease